MHENEKYKMQEKIKMHEKEIKLDAGGVHAIKGGGCKQQNCREN